MQPENPAEVAKSLMQDILIEAVERDALVSLLHPAIPHQQNICVMHLVRGEEKYGIRIPTDMYPRIVDIIKIAARINPKIRNVPLSMNMRVRTSENSYFFEVTIEPTNNVLPEQVTIKRIG